MRTQIGLQLADAVCPVRPGTRPKGRGIGEDAPREGDPTLRGCTAPRGSLCLVPATAL